MFENYIEEFKELAPKEVTHEYGLTNYHVRIGDLKKIIKRDKLKNNYDIGIQMVYSDVYDLVNMGFIFLNTKSLSVEEVIDLSKKITEPYLVVRHVSVFVAENENFEILFDYFLEHNLLIYYAAVMGRVIMDPEYNPNYLSDVLDRIGHDILKQNDELLIWNMNYCLASIAVQVPELTIKAMSIYDGYKNEIKVDKITNPHNWYESAKERGHLAKKRKSCRC